MDQHFCNTEDGVTSHEIADTGDYLVRREGDWYYWVGGTSPTQNNGPHATPRESLAAYNARRATAHTLTDVDGMEPEGRALEDLAELIELATAARRSLAAGEVTSQKMGLQGYGVADLPTERLAEIVRRVDRLKTPAK